MYTRENVSSHENPDLFARNKIAEVHGEGVSQENVIISSSGANAFYSLFIIHINFLLKRKERFGFNLAGYIWIQLKPSSSFCKEDEIIFINKPSDLKAISYNFEKFGDQIAGVVTEFYKPTITILRFRTNKGTL